MTDALKIMSTPLPEPVKGTGHEKQKPSMPSFEELLDYHNWRYEIHHSKIGDNAVIFYQAYDDGEENIVEDFSTTLQSVRYAVAGWHFTVEIIEDTLEVFKLNDLDVASSISQSAKGLETLLEFARFQEVLGKELEPAPAYCFAQAALDFSKIALPADIVKALSNNLAEKRLQ